MSNWEFNKRVDIGHLIVTIGMIVAAIWWGAQMDSRVSVLESQAVSSAERRGAMEVRITTRLESIDRKIDRLIERELDE